MMALSTDRTKRLLSIHGWSGAVLGLFLYVVVLTGALAVFASEIAVWSVGGKSWDMPLGRWTSVAVRETAEMVPEAYHEEVSVFHNSEGRLVLFWHTHAVNPAGNFDDKGVLFELDPVSFDILAQREGFTADVFGQDPAGALDEFLVDLHVSLHAPDPWGLYLTGVLGFAMLVAAVSGVILHRHLLADLFLSPRRSSALLTARDRHNLIGSWGLPFAFVLAFTGAFLSFAGALGLPLLSTVAFGGDERAMIETFFGEDGQGEAARPAALAHLDGVLAQSEARAGAPAEFVVISHYGQSDAEITVSHPPVSGEFRDVQMVFDGVSGQFERERPLLGTEPSAGDTLFALSFALHFGTFAGVLSQVVWLGLGLAMAYLALTGVRLWVVRRAEAPVWTVLARLVPGVGYGLPLALCGASAAFFVSGLWDGQRTWTPVGFCVAAGAAVWLAWRAETAEHVAARFVVVLGLGMIALPVLRVMFTGLGWFETDGGMVLLVDVLLVAGGVAFVPAFRARVAAALWRVSGRSSAQLGAPAE